MKETQTVNDLLNEDHASDCDDSEWPYPIYIAFKEGVIWNFAHDSETAQDWLDRGLIECYARFDPATDLVYLTDTSKAPHNNGEIVR